MIELITAVTKNMCIGNGNSLPWRKMKDDMEFFRQTTTGKAVIMGRRTFESIGSKALPNRLNIVVSKTLDPSTDHEISVAENIETAIELANKYNKTPIIIGGGKIYGEALNIVDVMYMTMVDTKIDGDAFFPEFQTEEWKAEIVKNGVSDDKNEFDYTIYKMIKR